MEDRFSGHGCTLRLFQNFGKCCTATFRVKMATAMYEKLQQFQHTFDMAKPQKLKLHIRQRTCEHKGKKYKQNVLNMIRLKISLS